MTRVLGLIGIALCLLAAPPARAATTAWVGDSHAAVRLLAVPAAGAQDRLEAGIEIRLAPGWHTYWRTPGDAGFALAADWTGSENVAAAAVSWPAPTRLVVEGLQNTVYEGSVVLPVSVSIARPGEPVRLRASLQYAACAEVCVPEHAELALDLPATGAVSAGPESAVLAAALGRVPGGLAAASARLIAATLDEAASPPVLAVTLRSDGRPFATPDLFVEGVGSGSPAAPQVELDEAGHVAHLLVRLPSHGTEIAGTPVELTLVDGRRTAEFTAVPAPSTGGPGLLAILSAALLGGLILNAMPCVLPVLSLKLLGLANQAGAGRRAFRLGLLATAAGILACFLLLAAALTGLKATGAAVGWGIQFQRPWFLGAMAALTTLFAANLWDWLHIGVPGIVSGAASVRGRGRLTEAFLTGAFATLLATPCSAPFVGTAVGFALAGTPAATFGVFACLGLGMAVPYLGAAALPGLVCWLPRPGQWMLTLRRVLGLALLGTAAWLLLVLAAVAGMLPAAATATALVVTLGLLAWRHRRGPGRTRRPAGAAAAALAAAVALPAIIPPAAPAAVAAAGPWQPFDPAALTRLVGEGKIVVVDVTAAWCLTCKVNEAAVLDRGEVARRLRRPGVVAMRADWTHPDPAVTAYLQSFGRQGVPLNVIYGPSQPRGEPLPELLTSGAVLRALDAAAPLTAGTSAGRAA